MSPSALMLVSLNCEFSFCSSNSLWSAVCAETGWHNPEVKAMHKPTAKRPYFNIGSPHTWTTEVLVKSWKERQIIRRAPEGDNDRVNQQENIASQIGTPQSHVSIGGTNGFSDFKIAHAGKTDPIGQIELESGGNVHAMSGSGWLA
jgi:hypothetical protein